jgi:hypothetical protein
MREKEKKMTRLRQQLIELGYSVFGISENDFKHRLAVKYSERS